MLVVTHEMGFARNVANRIFLWIKEKLLLMQALKKYLKILAMKD